MADDFRARSWWGAFPLDEEAAARWRIGPLRFYAHRRRHEWRLAFAQEDDPLDETVELEHPFPPDQIPNPPEAVRFGFVRSPAALHITPALADRSIVLRPAETLLIGPGDGVDVYVSTPLWLKVSFQAGARKATAAAEPMQHEVPLFRPSDTWFGVNTLEGELCYASRTLAYLDPDDRKRRPHRARTVVHVRNRGDDALRLDRLNVPVRHLSLYAADDGTLWTERVTLTRDDGGGLAAMRVGQGAPPEARGAVKLAEPRARAETNVVVRAFEAFFKENQR